MPMTFCRRLAAAPPPGWHLPIALTLLAALLLAASASAREPAAAPLDPRLGDAVWPVRQEIFLEVDAEQESYRGSVRIELEVREKTPSFQLHSEGPELDSLRLERATENGAENDAGVEIAVSHRPVADDVVELSTESALEPGSYVLSIDFTNAFDTKATSLYRTVVDGAAYTFTQFEADDAREAFPCFDEPRFKFPYQVTLKVPEAHLAVTNTPVEEESVADGWRTTRFAETPPVPSYLLALATGPLEAVEMPGLGVPARLVTVRGQSHLTTLARDATPPLLAGLEAYFGSSYPYRKLDFIAVPEFWPGAMENPGAITYADRLLVMDPAVATVGARRSQAGVIAHELAHQWFGNLVTMEWWDDLWLNESFADWMGDKIAHQVFPDLGIRLSSVSNGQGIMGRDARDTSAAIRKPIKSTDTLMQDVGLAYAKGKTVLAMFEQWLGEDVFRRGVLDYIEARRWKNATAEDLFKSLSKASGEPIGETMATFIDQPGVPRIDVEPLGAGRVRVSQQRFRYHGASSPDQMWKVPVILRAGHDGGEARRTILLTGKSMEVDLGLEGEPSWIYPNAGAFGYYRWSLPPAQLEKLIQGGLEHLEPAERINVVSNASALLQAGDMDGGTFLGVLERLAADSEPMVLTEVLDELFLVETAFVPDALEDAYGAWLRSAFVPALERIGRERRDGEAETVALLRPRLLGLLADEAGDAEVVAHFKGLAKAYLDDPSSVDPTLAGLAVRTLAKDGGVELYEQLLKRAEAAKTPQERRLFLGALGSFEDETLRRRALAYAISGPVRPNEIFLVAGGVANTEEGQDELFTFVIENFDQLSQKLPPQFRGFMPRLADGCSKERLEKAEEFFSRPDVTGPGVERGMAQVRESVGQCTALRARESASVAAFLGRYAAEN